MVSSNAGLQEKLTTFGKIVSHEQELIGQRMSWLMTLNGFVVGATVLLVRSAEPDNKTLGIALVAATSLGAFSNLATFFSNYWAEIAIQEADLALRDWVEPEEQKELGGLLRLYGRDLSDQQVSTRASLFGGGRPITVVLHPWFSLPALFWLVFSLAGLLATFEPMNLNLLVGFGPSLFLSLTAGGLVWAERRLRRRRIESQKLSGS